MVKQGYAAVIYIYIYIYMYVCSNQPIKVHPNKRTFLNIHYFPLHASVRRQLYLDAPDVLLPEPISDIPAPIVLPSGIVPDSGAVPSAGAIAPAPVIDPAPAILPANAIMEKNRATPVDKGSL